MRPTEIRLYPFSSSSDEISNLKGYAKIELDGRLIIQDIRIICVPKTGHKFVAFPSRRRGIRCENQDCLEKHDPGDQYCPSCGTRQQPVKSDDMRFTCHRDCCFPRTADIRNEIETAILRAYEISVAHPDLNSFIELGSKAQVYIHRLTAREIQHDGKRGFRGIGRSVPGESGEDEAIGEDGEESFVYHRPYRS